MGFTTKEKPTVIEKMERTTSTTCHMQFGHNPKP
jgi:hypothetical protein